VTALHSRAAEALAPYRRDETDGARLAMAPPPGIYVPAWAALAHFLDGAPRETVPLPMLRNLGNQTT